MEHKKQSIEQILNALQDPSSFHLFSSHYGYDYEKIKERICLIEKVVKEFQSLYPSVSEIYLFRVPARINLMGVHIDHRGGWCNYVPVAREMVFCFSENEDDVITAHNIDSEYENITFSIENDFPEADRGNWIHYIEQVEVTRGEWGNYLKAGAFKFQDLFLDRKLKGVKMVVGGDIPTRSGLSSSSSLVVGTVMALCAVNDLELDRSGLVELCGEGEWYVGTRGGAGDHSAMLLGRRGMITHTGFKPLTYEYCPFPENYDVVIAQSGIEAAKASGAREIFNSRIAAYEAGFCLFKHLNPQWEQHLHFIRDISPNTLPAGWAEIYKAIKKIPVQISLKDLSNQYPALEESLARIRSHFGVKDEGLPLREVLFFGIAECDRSKRFARFLEQGEVERAGALMFISHDGDRINTWHGEKAQPYRSPYEDAHFDELRSQLEKNPMKDELSGAFQPGGYRCSVAELDRMVDVCRSIKGVVGAGLTGAGLGGSILILVKKPHGETVVDEMKKLIGEWPGRNPLVEICHPVSGADFIDCFS